MSEGSVPHDGVAPFSAIEEHHGVTRIESNEDIALRKELGDRGNFTFVGRFNEGNVAWAAFESSAYHPFRQAVLIDRDGVLVTEKEFDSPGRFSEGLAVTTDGFIDTTGELILPRGDYSTITFSLGKGDFRDGLAAVQTSTSGFNGLFSYINHDGNFITEDRFTIANPFSNGLASVREDQYYGYIDKQGNWVKRDLAHTSSFDSGVASIQESFTQPFFIIDKDGKKIPTEIPVVCIGPFSEGFAWATDGKKLVLLDKDGRVKIKTNDYIGGIQGAPDSYLSRLPKPVSDGMSLVNFINGLQTIIPELVSRKGDGQGYLSIDDERFGPFRSAGQFVDGFGYVETGDKYKGIKKFFIDKKGNKVPEFQEREYPGVVKSSISGTIHDLGWRWRNRNRK